jgi:hypothetical protein
MASQLLCFVYFSRNRLVISGLKASTPHNLNISNQLLPESETWGEGVPPPFKSGKRTPPPIFGR